MVRIAALSLILASVALAPFAMAQDGPVASEDNPVTKPPAWVVHPIPSPDQYPKFASIIGLDGKVNVACDVTVEGRPLNCVVNEAIPAGAGFEDIAIQIVEAARLTPAQTAKGPVEAQIATNINFSLMPPEAEPVWAGGPKPTAAQLIGAQEVVRRYRQLGWNQTQMVDEGFGLAELTPQRRHTIRPWVLELFASDYSDEGRARSMALVLAQRGLDRLPTTKPDDWDTVWFPQLRAASSLGFDREGAVAEIKRRYCAAFDCAPETPTP